MLTEIKLQNPQASKPLVIDLNIECNTTEDKIYSNILTNSARQNEWIKVSPLNHRKAIICGSSPSIRDNLINIQKSKDCGGDVFSLNGCAKFLAENGIFPDYQVIMDAQPRTKELIGPANVYLFASQVDPSLFDEKPNAVLWHASHGRVMVDELEGFPKRQEDYCIIGSAATVGNTALALVYAMGYREIEIYGMDSSHRDGEGHAFHQAMNDGDPCTIVKFGGKSYVCSFTMKLQADTFMSRAKLLQKAGCVINVYGDGLIPDMWKSLCHKDLKRTEIPNYPKHEIIVAFLWRGEHPNAVPTKEYAPKMLASVRKQMPSAHVIQLTYPGFETLEGIDEVFYMEEMNDRHIWACEAFAQIVERGKPVLFIGTDVILQDDVSNVFNFDFDVASSRYPTYTRDDGVFCWDVQFAKPSAAQFYRDMIQWYKENTGMDQEEDGQTSFTQVAEQYSHKVLSLDFDDYCFTPEVQSDDVSKAAIVHYRGARKTWM